jgi:hypothetical protein
VLEVWGQVQSGVRFRFRFRDSNSNSMVSLLRVVTQNGGPSRSRAVVYRTVS